MLDKIVCTEKMNCQMMHEKDIEQWKKFHTPVFDEKKKTYAISWADFVSLLEDKQLRRLYLREVA